MDDRDSAARPVRPVGAFSDLVHSAKHGPLPVLLLVLTVVTGLVDAVSILSLGRVFVANMTGNVVFVGFALAGAPGFSLAASLAALAGFLVGAAIGGAFAARWAGHRGVLLRNGVALELALLVVGLIVSAVSGSDLGAGARDTIAAVAATAMGVQNAVVRKIAVPDLTTTVLTMTLTGIAADLRARNGPVAVRRLLAVLTMFGGAVWGALLVLHVGTTAALIPSVVLMAIVTGAAAFVARGSAAWHSA